MGGLKVQKLVLSQFRGVDVPNAVSAGLCCVLALGSALPCPLVPASNPWCSLCRHIVAVSASASHGVLPVSLTSSSLWVRLLFSAYKDTNRIGLKARPTPITYLSQIRKDPTCKQCHVQRFQGSGLDMCSGEIQFNPQQSP